MQTIGDAATKAARKMMRRRQGDFTIVLRDSDPHHVRHADVAEGMLEAERLAQANPGRRFYALATMASFCVEKPAEDVQQQAAAE